MKLLFLSESNLRDRMFVRDLVHNCKFQDKILVIHEAYGGRADETRMATKKLSALFSETLVHNVAFMAGQRNLFSQDTEGRWHLKTDMIRELVQPVRMVIFGPVTGPDSSPVLADAVSMALAARTQLGIEDTFVFTANPLSLLASRRELIDTEDDAARLLPVYEEEAAAIGLARRLRPARIVSPVNYAM
ncbi:MAG: hypothetical protein SF053_07835 [Bacteroidia bacterium]|nr:hypothetical protein [Bacteroidia bacterium]